MSVKLLTLLHLEFLSLKRGSTGSSQSTLVKMPHCWKSHVAANMVLFDSTLFVSMYHLPAFFANQRFGQSENEEEIRDVGSAVHLV